jgi:hypothetical protein
VDVKGDREILQKIDEKLDSSLRALTCSPTLSRTTGGKQSREASQEMLGFSSDNVAKHEITEDQTLVTYSMLKCEETSGETRVDDKMREY